MWNLHVLEERAQVSTTHLDSVAGGILVAFSPARPPSTPRAGIGAGPARDTIQIMLLVVPGCSSNLFYPFFIWELSGINSGTGPMEIPPLKLSRCCCFLYCTQCERSDRLECITYQKMQKNMEKKTSHKYWPDAERF